MPCSFAALPASIIASIQCGDSVPMFSTSAARERDHLLDLLARVRHHGQRAERKRRVRRLVHDDVVRDLVDERLARAQLAQCASRCNAHAAPLRSKTSTGPSPAPISASPCRTAPEATRAASRAASSRSIPFARPAASVAECVHPAPWVAPVS